MIEIAFVQNGVVDNVAVFSDTRQVAIMAEMLGQFAVDVTGSGVSPGYIYVNGRFTPPPSESSTAEGNRVVSIPESEYNDLVRANQILLGNSPPPEPEAAPPEGPNDLNTYTELARSFVATHNITVSNPETNL